MRSGIWMVWKVLMFQIPIQERQ
jgi:hypothetical protein